MGSRWSDDDEAGETCATAGPTVQGLLDLRDTDWELPVSEAVDAWLRAAGQDEETVHEAGTNLVVRGRLDWTDRSAFEVAMLHFVPRTFLEWNVSARMLCSLVSALRVKVGHDDGLMRHLDEGAAAAIVELAMNPAVPAA